MIRSTVCTVSALALLVAALLASGCTRGGYTYHYYPDRGVYFDPDHEAYYWYEEETWHHSRTWEEAGLGSYYVVHSAHPHPRDDYHFHHHYGLHP